ncbi:MAG: substrate-binding domain-containing protein [Deltaproteobacteria bacterium]|nr:substrate-binding domain-containing protein [Deltaproteobacteria bacterium]
MRTMSSEIRVMTSGAFTAAYLELIPQLELLTKRKIVTAATSMGTGPDSIPSRLQRGEPVDVVIVADAALVELIKGGMILAESRTPLARSAIGMAVRAGTPKPDISSVDALKRTLLQAKSIAYSASVRIDAPSKPDTISSAPNTGSVGYRSAIRPPTTYPSDNPARHTAISDAHTSRLPPKYRWRIRTAMNSYNITPAPDAITHTSKKMCPALPCIRLSKFPSDAASTVSAATSCPRTVNSANPGSCSSASAIWHNRLNRCSSQIMERELFTIRYFSMLGLFLKIFRMRS